MAIAATNSYNGKGIAESFEDVIFDISPEDTPLLSAAKRTTAGQTFHQWKTLVLNLQCSYISITDAFNMFMTAVAQMPNYEEYQVNIHNMFTKYE